jgi:hypothetical protein
MNGSVQHLEPRACVGNDSVVFPPELKVWCIKIYVALIPTRMIRSLEPKHLLDLFRLGTSGHAGLDRVLTDLCARCLHLQPVLLNKPGSHRCSSAPPTTPAMHDHLFDNALL